MMQQPALPRPVPPVEEVLNHNFVAGDVLDGDFSALYRVRRRDSLFAFVYLDEAGETIALRDHLGMAPLYYRAGPAGLKFSLSLNDLLLAGDELDERGAGLFVAFGTGKLAPLVRGVGIVPPGTVLKFPRGGGEPEVLYEYRIEPEPPVSATLEELADEADRLMAQAVERTLESDTVGLYMSGGIDSALVAFYLKRAGAAVNAYTCAPWGEGGSDIPFAKLNARLAGIERHAIVPLDTARYGQYVGRSNELYGSPNGTTTMIGVASLFEGSAIGDEAQVYLGHQADSMTCSSTEQYLVYLTHRLPPALRRRLHPLLGSTHPLSDFLSYQTQGQVTEYEEFPDAYRDLDPVSLLTLAALYIGQTPAHGEVLVEPVMRRGALASDPYYDMDLVELCLRIPRRHRIVASRGSKLVLALDKRIFRALARRYLPRKAAKRKKAFTIPFARDDASRDYAESLPASFDGSGPLPLTHHRLAAEVLNQFVRRHRLKAGAVSPLRAAPS